MTTTAQYVRQGITLGGVDVVLVAMTQADIDRVRELTEWAVSEHGIDILRSAHYGLDDGGERYRAIPVHDGVRMVGVVELAL